MNLWRLVPLLLCSVISAEAKSLDNQLTKKLIEEVKKTDGLLRLKNRSFSKFVLANERPYNLLLYVGADAHYCAACQTLLKTFKRVIPKVIAASGSRDYVVDSDGVPTFFAYLEATADRDITRMLGLTFIPQLIRISPDNLQCLTSDGRRRSDVAEAQKSDVCTVSAVNALVSDPDPESEVQLVTTLAAQLGLDHLPHKIFPPSRKKIVLGGAFILALLTVVITNLERIQNFFVNHRPIIAVMGILSFTLSTSGLIYNLQHGMRLTGVDPRTRETVWISRQGRTQYLAEGLMFSGLTEVFCLALWLAVNVTPAACRLKGISWVAKHGAVFKLLSTLLMIGSYIAFRTLSSVVLMKHPFLRPSFLPDTGFVKGAIRNDRMYGI